MQYVCSDLHGFSLEKFENMLEKIGFNDDDFLWVLGDVIDRGDDGVRILKWLMAKTNAQLILGNHESMLLSCDFMFQEITERSVSELTRTKLKSYTNWAANGAQPTLKALSSMRSKEIGYIVEYLREAPLYEVVSAGGKDFVLTHSGLGNFDKDKKLREYSIDDFLWNRPGIDDKYFDGITVVFGHTPTFYYGDEFKGKAVFTDSWIDVDTGAGCGLNPMILRLDDLKEFYFDENMKLI